LRTASAATAAAVVVDDVDAAPQPAADVPGEEDVEGFEETAPIDGVVGVVGVDGVVGVALGVGGKVSAGAGHVRAEGVAWQGQSRSC
jgi:hypothetical protein